MSLPSEREWIEEGLAEMEAHLAEAAMSQEELRDILESLADLVGVPVVLAWCTTWARQ